MAGLTSGQYVTAWATSSASAPLEKATIRRRAPGPHDVLITIAYCGICHSDIHTARGEWGRARYPVVPGHEIAGVVAEVGSDVTRHAVGDRVGVGYFVDSCRACESCVAGEEQHCTSGLITTYNGIGRDGETTKGGYSEAIVVDENYVLRIPGGIALDRAAPLLCAGVTLYSPLKRHGAGPGKRVAIVGLGGLGHIGVKIAHALGADITVLSRSLSKRDEALALGADHYFATEDRATFSDLAAHFDLIVNTIGNPLDIDRHLALLRLDGTFVNLGLPTEPMSINAFSLLRNRRSLTSSLVGGIAITQEMLDFCAAHGIGADIEVVSGDEIEATYDRVVDGRVRFRAVIDTATF